MQVVVKKPHIRITGEISRSLVEYLRRKYGTIEIVQDKDEELIEVKDSYWYRSILPTIKPEENLRIYRQIHNLTQAKLGKALGNFTRQNISNMENGHRAISKATAKKLSKLFDVSVEKFV